MKETDIWDLTNATRERMTFAQKKFWDLIRIDPEEWAYRASTGNDRRIWVVALVGRNVISYNDLEHGFDRSSFGRYGEISRLGWDQAELGEVVQHLLNELEFGHRTSPGVSEPRPGTFPGRDSG